MRVRVFGLWSGQRATDRRDPAEFVKCYRPDHNTPTLERLTERQLGRQMRTVDRLTLHPRQKSVQIKIKNICVH